MDWTVVSRDPARTGTPAAVYPHPPRFTSQTSALFLLSDLAIDEIANIVAILFLFLEKRIVGGFNFDIVVRHDHGLVLAGVGFLEWNQLRCWHHFYLILVGPGGAMDRARKRRCLRNRPAFRTGGGRFVKIEKTRAAVLAMMLITEFGFGHGTYLSKERLCGPVSDAMPACQMEVESRSRFDDSVPSAMLPASRKGLEPRDALVYSRLFVCGACMEALAPALVARAGGPLRGRLKPPGDKSISHRALILGLLCVGETKIEGLLEGDDVLRTAAACAALGAKAERRGEGRWLVQGCGIGSLLAPRETLDFGNSGTGMRLMMGVAGGHAITACFDGDASLRKRPMQRILDPLCLMGAEVLSQSPGGRCPVLLRGTSEPVPITFSPPVASAQIKSAVLLAGLNSPGRTTVIEAEATRDHTEKMLKYFGASIQIEPFETHGRKISLDGRPELRPAHVIVPADPSSAAFPMVAATLVPGSGIVIEGMMMNPLRRGLLTTLLEMGADIEILDRRGEGGEEVADLRVRAAQLKGVEVPGSRAPSMIDEYPILAVAAAFACGETRMRGLAELRVKESDRLGAVAKGLREAGVENEIAGDDLIVEGRAGDVPGGGTVMTHLDHRIAMSFLCLGLASRSPMAIDDSSMIATSFPKFRSLMERLGARFE